MSLPVSIGSMPHRQSASLVVIGFAWDGLYRHLYVDGVEVARDDAPLTSLKGSDAGGLERVLEIVGVVGCNYSSHVTASPLMT